MISKTPMFYISMTFNCLVLLLTILHKDIMVYGFCVLNNIFFCYTSFYEKKESEIKNNIETIIVFILIFSLFFSAISLILNKLILESGLLEKLHTYGIKFFDDKVNTYYGGRLIGLGGHPNTTGVICAIGIMCSEYILLRKQQNMPILLCSYINIILGILCIIKASSRTSMLAVTIFSFIFLLCFILNWKKLETNQKKHFFLFCIMLLVFFILFFIVLWSISDNPIDIIKTKILRTDTIKGATGRVNIQEKVLNLSKGHVLSGIPDSSIINTIGYTAHNAYIQVFASSGIFGLILYIAMWIYAVYSNIRTIYLNYAANERIDYLILSAFLLSTVIAAIFYSFYEATFYLDLSLPTYFVTYCVYLSGLLYDRTKRTAK